MSQLTCQVGFKPTAAHWMEFLTNGSKQTFTGVFQNIDISAIENFASTIRMSGHHSTKTQLDSSSSKWIPCKVLPKPLHGTYNIVFQIEFSDGVRWMLKVPANGHRSQWNLTSQASLRSEAQTMQMLKRETQIPVPTVYAFETSLDNELGVPFMLMEKLPGIQAQYVWYNDQLPTKQLEKARARMLQGIAAIMVQLNSYTFDQSGSLEFDDDGKFIRIGERKMADGIGAWDGVEEHLCTETKNIWTAKAPSTDPKSEYLFTLGRLPNGIPVGAHTLQKGGHKSLLHFIDWACEVTKFAGKRFVLCHPDLDVQNILVADDGTITGILDWDGAAAVPREIGCSMYPIFLIKAILEDEEQIDPVALESYRAIFAQFMEVEIERQVGGMTELGTTPRQEADITRRSELMKLLDWAGNFPRFLPKIVEYIHEDIEALTAGEWDEIGQAVKISRDDPGPTERDIAATEVAGIIDGYAEQDVVDEELDLVTKDVTAPGPNTDQCDGQPDSGQPPTANSNTASYQKVLAWVQQKIHQVIDWFYRPKTKEAQVSHEFTPTAEAEYNLNNEPTTTMPPKDMKEILAEEIEKLCKRRDAILEEARKKAEAEKQAAEKARKEESEEAWAAVIDKVDQQGVPLGFIREQPDLIASCLAEAFRQNEQKEKDEFAMRKHNAFALAKPAVAEVVENNNPSQHRRIRVPRGRLAVKAAEVEKQTPKAFKVPEEESSGSSPDDGTAEVKDRETPASSVSSPRDMLGLLSNAVIPVKKGVTKPSLKAGGQKLMALLRNGQNQQEQKKDLVIDPAILFQGPPMKGELLTGIVEAAASKPGEVTTGNDQDHVAQPTATILGPSEIKPLIAHQQYQASTNLLELYEEKLGDQGMSDQRPIMPEIRATQGSEVTSSEKPPAPLKLKDAIGKARDNPPVAWIGNIPKLADYEELMPKEKKVQNSSKATGPSAKDKGKQKEEDTADWGLISSLNDNLHHESPDYRPDGVENDIDGFLASCSDSHAGYVDDGTYTIENVCVALGRDELDELRLLRMKMGFLMLMQSY